jgi:hypothetical protein
MTNGTTRVDGVDERSRFSPRAIASNFLSSKFLGDRFSIDRFLNPDSPAFERVAQLPGLSCPVSVARWPGGADTSP